MAKFKDFEDLEEYVEDEEYEYDYDSSEYEEVEYVDDLEEGNTISYEEYSDDSLELNTKYDEDYDEYEDYDSLKFDDDKKVDFINILNFCSNWFIKAGIIIAICLVITFFVTGKVILAFAYIFGLVVAFSIGYVFMYFVDHFFAKADSVERF